MSEKKRIRMKSILPKNAVNFYNLKKGLYLKNYNGAPNNIRDD
jgi:hypothetical protein